MKGREQDLERREKVVAKAEEVIAKHPDGAIVKALASRLYDLNQTETNACWDAMKVKADEIRAARFQARSEEEQTKKRGR